jgi:hypothetical protein
MLGLRPATALAVAAVATACGGAAPSTTPEDANDQHAPETAVEPGQLASVVVDRLTVRTAPGEEQPAVTYGVADAGRAAEVELTVAKDDLILVTSPSIESSGVQWAEVAVNIGNHFFEPIRVGWIPLEMAQGPSVLEFDPEQCPSTEDGYLSDSVPAHSLVVLTCFGSSELRVEGAVRDGNGVPCVASEWLRCPWASVPSVASLPVFVDPAAGTRLPPADSLVTVTGHFDDPRAARCDDDMDGHEIQLMAVLRCRTSFVVDEVVSPPSARLPVSSFRPLIESAGTETYADGAWTRHFVRVVNWDELDGEIFGPAPDLPACGGIAPAARAWVRILDEGGHELALYCQPGPPELLSLLAFVRRTGSDLPAAVYIEILDRLEQVTYVSEPIEIGP